MGDGCEFLFADLRVIIPSFTVKNIYIGIMTKIEFIYFTRYAWKLGVRWAYCVELVGSCAMEMLKSFVVVIR